jgi:hypothetical protein
MDQLSVLRKFPGELHIRPVVDAADQPLGWAVRVLIDIDDASTSPDCEQQAADIQQAEFLVLRHCISQDEAFIVKQGIQTFIRENRKMLADLAFPTEFWEWNVLTSTQAMDVRWTLLGGSDLNKFRTEQHPLKCKREDWCPISSYSESLLKR